MEQKNSSVFCSLNEPADTSILSQSVDNEKAPLIVRCAGPCYIGTGYQPRAMFRRIIAR